MNLFVWFAPDYRICSQKFLGFVFPICFTWFSREFGSPILFLISQPVSRNSPNLDVSIFLSFLFIYVPCNIHSCPIHEQIYVFLIYWGSPTRWLATDCILEHFTQFCLKILCFSVTESNFLKFVFLTPVDFFCWIWHFILWFSYDSIHSIGSCIIKLILSLFQ